MAVQIRWQDGAHQWIRGRLFQGQRPYHDCRGFMRYTDGFTILDPNGAHIDFGCDVSVISLAPDDTATDYSRRENQS